jgi:type II secretory pathway pseudopilin PulG
MKMSIKNQKSFLCCSFVFVQSSAKNPSEQGLTLIEAIVGILIIAIVLAASTPPLLYAAATRIQNRRAEQAIQIAQRELDRVRLLMEQGEYENTCTAAESIKCLPPVATVSANNLQEAAAPTTSCLSSSSSCFASDANKVIEEGDFLIQTFRDPGLLETDVGNTTLDPTGAQIIAFRMGVRVYSKVAKENLDSLKTSTASLQITQGIGQQDRQPLAVLYTDFVRGDITLSLQGYRDFLTP